MNDDDLLFTGDNLRNWTLGRLSDGWLTSQRDVMLRRCRDQSVQFKQLLASADQDTYRRLNRKI